jgi:hypothetical protein
VLIDGQYYEINNNIITSDSNLRYTEVIHVALNDKYINLTIKGHRKHLVRKNCEILKSFHTR